MNVSHSILWAYLRRKHWFFSLWSILALLWQKLAYWDPQNAWKSLLYLCMGQHLFDIQIWTPFLFWFLCYYYLSTYSFWNKVSHCSPVWFGHWGSEISLNSWHSFCLSISSARISDTNHHKPFPLQFQGGLRQTYRDTERELSTRIPHFSSYIVHTANKFFLQVRGQQTLMSRAGK